MSIEIDRLKEERDLLVRNLAAQKKTLEGPEDFGLRSFTEDSIVVIEDRLETVNARIEELEAEDTA